MSKCLAQEFIGLKIGSTAEKNNWFDNRNMNIEDYAHLKYILYTQSLKTQKKKNLGVDNW